MRGGNRDEGNRIKKTQIRNDGNGMKGIAKDGGWERKWTTKGKKKR